MFTRSPMRPIRNKKIRIFQKTFRFLIGGSIVDVQSDVMWWFITIPHLKNKQSMNCHSDFAKPHTLYWKFPASLAWHPQKKRHRWSLAKSRESVNLNRCEKSYSHCSNQSQWEQIYWHLTSGFHIYFDWVVCLNPTTAKFRCYRISHENKRSRYWVVTAKCNVDMLRERRFGKCKCTGTDKTVFCPLIWWHIRRR